jgi:hypothetical protein
MFSSALALNVIAASLSMFAVFAPQDLEWLFRTFALRAFVFSVALALGPITLFRLLII